MVQSESVALIRGMLEHHHPADDREADSLSRIKRLVETATEPFSRQHYVPGHLTASAVVVDSKRERTLLIFHDKLKRWLQPGGHFEPGESDPSVAAAREVIEETGLSTQWPGAAPQLLDVDVHLIPARKNEPAHEHFDLRMLLISDASTATAGDGVSQARWATPPEWPGLDLDPGIQRALKKIF
jgi:8-oxo-dGTP pyrophosphatase MutT (NUDIX family)